MIRRLAAAAAVPMIAGLGVALAAPAHADAGSNSKKNVHSKTFQRGAAKVQAGSPTISFYGSCRLIVPRTARVVQDFYEVPVRVTGGCALHPGPTAIWYIGRNFMDSTDGIFFDDAKSSTWDLYNDTPLGTPTWTGLGAVDDNDNFYSQDAPRTTVKVGSWAGLQTKRSGNTITIDSRAVRYATSLDYTIPWAGQGATIQYRTIGSSIWTNLKLATTNPKGAITYNYTTTAKRDYRVRYNEAAYIWGATSPTSRR